jgi:hypothetical protein
MTSALEGVRGQRHAPAAPYTRVRPGTHFTQSNQTVYKLDVQCLTVKFFAMSRTSDAELFTLCVILNVDGIVQRELW